MTEFDFIARQKVTGWQTTKFQVTADSKEEAVELLKNKLINGERIDEDNETISIYDDEFAYEDATLVKVHENGGTATLEIIDEEDKELGHVLMNNAQYRDENINSDSFDVRFAKIMDDNVLNPLFIVTAFDVYSEIVSQLSNENLVKQYGFMYDAESIRNRVAKIQELLTKKND